MNHIDVIFALLSIMCSVVVYGEQFLSKDAMIEVLKNQENVQHCVEDEECGPDPIEGYA